MHYALSQSKIESIMALDYNKYIYYTKCYHAKNVITIL